MTISPSTGTVPAVSHIGRWVLLATITASSMAFIDSSALNVALTALQKDLHATGVQLIWVVNAYLLVLASLILLGGSLGDHFGRNRIFRFGIILFSGASFVCGLAPSIEILIVARAVQGIGGALMVPGSLAIISASFPAEARGQAIGTWSSVGTIVTISAPALGGYLAGAGLWRGVFFINIPLALVSLFALSRIPETRDAKVPHQLDYPGTVLITLGLAGLTYGTVQLGQLTSGSVDSSAWVSLLIGVAALVAFVFVEARSTHPIMPLRLFRERTFSGTNLLTLFLYGALSGTLYFFPLNLIQIQGYQAGTAGITTIPLSLLLVGLSPIMGRLVTRVGPRLLLTIGPLIVAVAFFVLGHIGLTAGPSAYWTTYFPAIVLLGLGMGITVAPLTTAVMGSVSADRAGVASGVNNAVARSAQGLAIAALGALALASFSATLTTRIAAINTVPPAIQQQIQQNATKLGNTDIPASLDSSTQSAVKIAIQSSFTDMFQLVMNVGAGLAVLSALSALLLIENRLPTAENIAKADGSAAA